MKILLNRVDRYIFKTVFSSFLIVTIVFCILFFIFTYLSEINKSSGSENLDLIFNSLYQLPGILYTLLPVCAMIGSLMALSILANNSEIIILRSSGHSTLRISKGVIIVGLIGSVITIIFGGYVAPMLQKLSDANQIQYKNKNIWLKTSDGVTHINHMDPYKKTAFGIRKFIIENNKLKEVSFAAKAKYLTDKSPESYNINKIIYPDKNKQKIVKIIKNINKRKWENSVPLSMAKIITVNNNDHLNLNQLFQFMLSDAQITNKPLSLKFWQEVFQPISLMILILLSVPLSIGLNRSSSFVIKLTLGAIFGFSFFIINQILGPVALILSIPPIFGAAGPTVVALVLLIYLFIKSKER